MMTIRLFFILLFTLLLIPCHAVNVAEDGFPAGQESAEGVAADLARAFIRHDYALFEKICLPLYGGEETLKRYREFRVHIRNIMQEEARKKEPSPGGPKSLEKVFAARHLSQSGAASYGYAVFGFEEVQFVDVGVSLVNGDQHLNRTLVVKKGGKWFVHPIPEISPLLSAGLNQESLSTVGWNEKDNANKKIESTR